MNRKFQIIILLFTLSSSSANIFAQEKNYVDSLLKIIKTTGNDTVKAYRYIDLSVATINSNPFIAKLYASKAHDIFERHANLYGIAMASLKIANSCRQLNEEANMLKNIKTALSISEQLHNDVLLSSCYHEMALIANEQNDLEKALSYNLKAIELRRKLKNDKEIAGLYNNTGIIYAKKNDWENGIKYFRMSYDFEKKFGSNLSLGNELNNMGIYFIFQKKYDSAFYFLNEGKKLRTISNDIQGLSGSFNNIALLNLELNKIDEAILYADTSYKLAKQVGIKSSELEVLLTYYSIYDKKKDYKNALEYYREAEKLRKTIESESNKRKLGEVQNSIDLDVN
ncbi:MAG: tetratricopeptide repeat protein [Bacteroidia bacterium]|nr:tetratricopeptide repeat protein [Bacteroidia bacterium]